MRAQTAGHPLLQ